MSAKDVFPCYIIKDRYGGCYSGGAWIAWPFDAEHDMGLTEMGDTESDEFWSDFGLDRERWHPCGRGKTPDDAYADLQRVCADPDFSAKLSAWFDLLNECGLS